MGATNCPETPRQKMITMMYLVYTAMLALNVSAQVVDGFKTVGSAMTKSNENLQVKLDDTYANFETALTNNKEKVQEEYDKAQEVRQLSMEMGNYIDSLMYVLMAKINPTAEIHTEGGKSYKMSVVNADEAKTPNFDSIKKAIDMEGFRWLKMDELHESTNLFAAEKAGNGPKLKEKIIEYKKRIKEILGEDSTKVAIALNVDDMPDPDNHILPWEVVCFNEVVSGSALVTLTRLKAETMNAEFDAVNMLYKHVSKGDFSFDKVAVITRARSSYIMQGGKYELVVNVGAYDSKAKFEANVGGARYTANDTGAVVYSTICNTTGPKTITGTVYVKNDNGTESYDFKETYFVAEPMAVFELTEMNVVYMGIDNPVRISIPGIAAHNMVVEVADPSQATIVPDAKAGAGNYIIKPKVNKGKIAVRASFKDGNITRFAGSTEFRARPLPDPKIFLGKAEAGKGIPINDLKNMKGPSVRYGPEFAFHMETPKIIKQTVDITKVNGATDLENRGPQWGADVLSYIQKAKPGCKITLSIDVTMPDGSKRNVSSTFRITR